MAKKKNPQIPFPLPSPTPLPDTPYQVRQGSVLHGLVTAVVDQTVKQLTRPHPVDRARLLELLQDVYVRTFERARLNYDTLAPRTADRLINRNRRAMEELVAYVTGTKLTAEEYEKLVS